jgi:hypothetical protein
MAWSALRWKSFYEDERAALGQAGLEARLREAPAIELPARGALVFPHTRLESSGRLAAAAAMAVVRSGADSVLALGVLHGAREQDRDAVEAARRGDPDALALLRRVHGPGTAGDAGHWNEEFSLDGFSALLSLAARLEGRPRPRLIARYPFLVGTHAADLPGLDELVRLREQGAALVATADPVHHGAGYGTAVAERLDDSDPQTFATAQGWVETAFANLAAADVPAFLAISTRVRSDFRDTGPVLRELLGAGRVEARVHELLLVDYADVLGAPRPTWVAGAVSTFSA